VLLRSQSPSLEQVGEEVTRGGRLGPVVLEFGRAAARDLITFVEAAPAEEHQGAAVFQLGGRLDGTEGSAHPVFADLEGGQAGEMKIGAIPQIGVIIRQRPISWDSAGPLVSPSRAAGVLAPGCRRLPRR
jgi:hypothetical protein